MSKIVKGQNNMGNNDKNSRHMRLNTREIIRRNITKLREDNNLLKKDVAEAIGVPPNTYRVWEDEDEESGVKPYRIVQLAKVYGVSTDCILLNHDEDFAQEDDSVQGVAAPNHYNKFVYGEKYLSELEDYEKLLVMKVRRLSKADKKRLNDYLSEMLAEMDQYSE